MKWVLTPFGFGLLSVVYLFTTLIKFKVAFTRVAALSPFLVLCKILPLTVLKDGTSNSP